MHRAPQPHNMRVSGGVTPPRCNVVSHQTSPGCRAGVRAWVRTRTTWPRSSARSKMLSSGSSTATKVGAASCIAKVAQRLEPKMLPFYLVLAAVLFPPLAAGQSRGFPVKSDVTVRADSFAAKRILRAGSPPSTQSKRRLHVRNTTVRLSQGSQMHWSHRRPRARTTRGQYVCIYDPKDNKMSIYPCAWTRTEMLSKCTNGRTVELWNGSRRVAPCASD
jgi:hypothetical protein